MRNPHCSTIKNNGDVVWEGLLTMEKGNHNNMPKRSEQQYLDGDIRFHVNASSLGGCNNRSNVVPGNNDVDKHSWTSIENSERTVLKNGGSIYSEKTAVVNGQAGERPTSFFVKDTVTYPDHHQEVVSHSFLNESFADQEKFNEISSRLSEAFSDPNPGDQLREEILPEVYADLMNSTDSELPTISTDYEQTDFYDSTLQQSASCDEFEATCDMDIKSESESDAEMDVSADLNN